MNFLAIQGYRHLVKTGEKVAETIRCYAPEGIEFDVVSNPQFLREGSAVADLLLGNLNSENAG